MLGMKGFSHRERFWHKDTKTYRTTLFLLTLRTLFKTELSDETPTRSIIYDDNHDNKGVATKTMAEAFKETDTHLKAIVWFACLMGPLEVLTEMAPYCDYQFASSHVSRAITEIVSTLIEALNESPDDFEKAAKRHCEKLEAEYITSFQNIPDDKDPNVKHQENCDFSCWRSDKLAAIR